MAKSKHKKQTPFIDKIIYVAAIAYPLTTIPQIVTIFVDQSSANVSLATWVLYDIFTIVFLWYAISKKIKPLVLEYSLWIVAQTIVVIGILIYR
ncbi:MAG: hypothetical protein WC549_06735 [Actinomycetota bacterium]